MQEIGDAVDQSLCVDGSADLGVIIKIDVDVAGCAFRRGFVAGALCVGRLSTASPGRHASSPLVEGFAVISAGVKLLRTMQSAVDKIRGDVHQARPGDCVSANQCDVIAAQQLDEFGIDKAGVVNFHSVTQLKVLCDAQPASAADSLVVATSQGLRR